MILKLTEFKLIMKIMLITYFIIFFFIFIIIILIFTGELLF